MSDYKELHDMAVARYEQERADIAHLWSKHDALQARFDALIEAVVDFAYGEGTWDSLHNASAEALSASNGGGLTQAKGAKSRLDALIEAVEDHLKHEGSGGDLLDALAVAKGEK